MGGAPIRHVVDSVAGRIFSNDRQAGQGDLQRDRHHAIRALTFWKPRCESPAAAAANSDRPSHITFRTVNGRESGQAARLPFARPYRKEFPMRLQGCIGAACVEL